MGKTGRNCISYGGDAFLDCTVFICYRFLTQNAGSAACGWPQLGISISCQAHNHLIGFESHHSHSFFWNVLSPTNLSAKIQSKPLPLTLLSSYRQVYFRWNCAVPLLAYLSSSDCLTLSKEKEKCYCCESRVIVLPADGRRERAHSGQDSDSWFANHNTEPMLRPVVMQICLCEAYKSAKMPLLTRMHTRYSAVEP